MSAVSASAREPIERETLVDLALVLGVDQADAEDLAGLTPEQLEALEANLRADLELAARATVEARNRRVRNRETNLEATLRPSG